jgi:hypothetical protein
MISGVPVTTLEKFRLRFRIQTYFQLLKICNKFSLREAAMFPRKLSSNVKFFNFFITFYVGSGPNPVPEPEPVPKCITVPVIRGTGGYYRGWWLCAMCG